MKILVIGAGGREHALVWKLSASPKCSQIFCAGENAGISQMATCVPIKSTDIDGLVRFAIENNIDLTVAGGEDSLSLGVVDKFEQAGLKIYGPRQNAAIVEYSKAFSKDFMKRNNIPTAKYETFDSYDKGMEYLRTQKFPIVIKADGLAAGKGVIIANSFEEAATALKDIMLESKFGQAGDSVVIEEFLVGREVSILAFTDGVSIVPMVSARDYKKAENGDLGLNTGGMGVYSPVDDYTDETAHICMEKIFKPTIEALKNEGREFKGTLYFGLILTEDGPKVIEYNCRFGDPETQVIMSLLDADLVDIMLAVIDGTLSSDLVKWKGQSAVCVILASKGYPQEYEVGKKIEIKDNDGLVFHAATRLDMGELLTAGGRVLSVVGLGNDVEEARKKAYETIKFINFDGMYYRDDIAE